MASRDLPHHQEETGLTGRCHCQEERLSHRIGLHRMGRGRNVGLPEEPKRRVHEEGDEQVLVDGHPVALQRPARLVDSLHFCDVQTKTRWCGTSRSPCL